MESEEVYWEMGIHEIVRRFMEERGFDALCRIEDGEVTCSCRLDGLFPCGHVFGGKCLVGKWNKEKDHGVPYGKRFSVRWIVRDWLESHDLHGLCSGEGGPGECGCGVSELFECGLAELTCVPAVFVPIGEWVRVRKKEGVGKCDGKEVAYGSGSS